MLSALSAQPKVQASQHQDMPVQNIANQGNQLTQSMGPGQKRKPIQVDKKIGRNEPCPCGSGKKYKKCHGTAK